MLFNAAPVGAGGLVNTASSYGYPLTNGLLGSLSSSGHLGGLLSNIPTAPPQPMNSAPTVQPSPLGSAPTSKPPTFGGSAPGVPNYSQIAYQNAGSPHFGPYAASAIPSGTGIPGSPQPTGFGNSTAAGLLGTLGAVALQNPSVVSGGINGLKGLLGMGGSSVPDSTAAALAGSLPTAADATAFTPTAASINAAADSAVPAALPGAAPLSIGADTGAAAASPIADAAGATGIGSADAAGASGAAGAADAGAAGGSLAGGLLGAGILAAPLIAGLSTPSVSLGSQYWSNAYNNVSKGLSQNAPGSPQYVQAQDQLMALLSNPYGTAPQNIQQLATQYGVVPFNQYVKNSRPSAWAAGGNGSPATRIHSF